MFYTINSSPMLVTKSVFKLIFVLSNYQTCTIPLKVVDTIGNYFVWQGCFFFHYYLATSMTDWAQIFTGLLFYAYKEVTPSEKTGLWQFWTVSSVFNSALWNEVEMAFNNNGIKECATADFDLWAIFTRCNDQRKLKSMLYQQLMTPVVFFTQLVMTICHKSSELYGFLIKFCF